MGDLKLKFDKKGQGGNRGDYEMFVWLESSQSNPTTIEFYVPTGWSAKAIKLYAGSEDSSGKFTPDPQKNADKGSLSGGSLANYQQVFNSATLPNGLSFEPQSGTQVATLTDDGSTDGTWEYLVWIQDASANNDYLDPGIKNH